MNDLIEDDTGETADVIEIPQHPDGIYLHMPEEEYHAQERMSASGVNKLRISEADFWQSSWMNPDRDDKPTDAQTLGRAFHTARLEPERLAERFIRDLEKDDMPEGTLFTDADVRAAIKDLQPKPENYPEALRADTDVKKALADLGQPQSQKGEDAAARRLRLRQHDASAVFWDDVLAEWENAHGSMEEPKGETPLERAKRLFSYGYEGPIWSYARMQFEAERGDRTALPSKFWNQIMQDVEDLKSSEIAQKYLTGGLPEVTVLWTDPDTGVKWKARIDYLRPDVFTDAKTFVNSRGKPVRECLADAFRYNGYFVQARVYREATEMIRSGAVTLQDAKESAVIDAVRARKAPLLSVYLFQQKEGIANVLAAKVRLDLVHPSLDAAAIGVDPEKAEEVAMKYAEPTLLCRRAEHEIAMAVNLFMACRDRYGSEKWRPLDPEFEINDNSYPGFWLEGEW